MNGGERYLEIQFTGHSIAAGSIIHKLIDRDRFCSPINQEYRYEVEPAGPLTGEQVATVTRVIRFWAPDLVALQNECKAVIAGLEADSGKASPATIEIREGEK